MAGLFFSTVQEFNTFVTMLGCLCATVQVATGYYAGYLKKKLYLLKGNDVLFRAHRAFGGFATILYFMGLFAGLSGFFGALLIGEPPLELQDASFNIHTWPSFIIMGILILKTYYSYFRKRSIYRTGKWLGIATFIAWAYTYITAEISFILRAAPLGIPGYNQYAAPNVLLPYEFLWLQLLLPFLIGILISIPILRAASRLEREKAAKKPIS